MLANSLIATRRQLPVLQRRLDAEMAKVIALQTHHEASDEGKIYREKINFLQQQMSVSYMRSYSHSSVPAVIRS